MPPQIKIEGNKALSKSVNGYIVKRDKIVRDNWKQDMFPVMKETKNEVLTKLQSYNTVDDWQLSNVVNIQSDIQQTVNKMEVGLWTALDTNQKLIATFAATHLDNELKFVKLKIPYVVFDEDVISNMQLLSKSFIKNFSNDVSKILNSEISLGLARGEGVNVVSRSIVDKFGLTENQIKLFKSDKERWDKMLRKGEVTQAQYDKRIRILNKRLQSGSMMSYARAEGISRTEMLRAGTMSRFKRSQDIQAENPQSVKAWLHSGNQNGREEHMRAEAQYKAEPIPVNEPFIVGGESGQFPRDIGFSAKNAVNCGCDFVIFNRERL